MSDSGVPTFSVDDARRLARDLYGIEVEARQLVSYQDQNFLLEHGSGRRLVLKLSHASVPREMLDLQNRAMEHIADRESSPATPRVCSTLGGERIVTVAGDDGVTHLARLVTFVEGTPWAAGAPHSPELGYRLGRFVGVLDRVLADFSHPAMHRFDRWDLKHTLEIREYLGAIPDPGPRPNVERVLARFEQRVLPLWSGLRASVIHGDANNDNILVSDDGTDIAGLIDFGDCVHSATICELAIAMAYLMLGQEEPLTLGEQVLRGYHETHPLEAMELDVLLDLVLCRLAISLAYSYRLSKLRPDNTYLTVNQENAGKLLERLIALDSGGVRERFGRACGDTVSTIDTAKNGRGRGRERILEARRRHIGASLSISYSEPLEIVRGAGPYLIDERGRAYLDAINNVCHVGHCHPRVVAAASAQMAVLNTNTRYLNDLLIDYAERLTATLPEPLRVCFFVNSGSEANDLALRMARVHTGRHDAVVVDGAYHGTTTSVVELSPYKFGGPGGAGRPDHVQVVPCPDVYRGPHGADDPQAGAEYAADVAAAIDRAGGPVAAFFCESMISCGGQIIPPPGYLRAAFDHVRHAGGVCVADEVQVGFGRAGDAFWAFDFQDAVPDIVTMGKPIGNGHPISALVTTPEIARSFANGMEYFNTFGGNPVSCAVGLAVLDVIEEEGLQERARVVGAHMLEGLRGLAERHALIGDVRGHGMFLGVELVRDRETLEPAREEATEVIERMKDRGVLLSTEGPFHNVIKIKPPLVWTTAHADFLVEQLDAVLTEGLNKIPS
ncbi:MAG: aminotransferase class III-fold pyridoxal phosphate-dependent enzyme [bacterium]|nr:aminotransferase class III-fold pyridoxal phosphate-dependent enzyme [bacterium]